MGVVQQLLGIELVCVVGYLCGVGVDLDKVLFVIGEVYLCLCSEQVCVVGGDVFQFLVWVCCLCGMDDGFLFSLFIVVGYVDGCVQQLVDFL